MNRYHLATIILLVFTTISFAQRKEKIKGSKIVTTEKTELDNFSRILIGENFKIAIIKSDTPSIEITADDNLHEIIMIEVIDETLVIKSSKRITSKKELDIKVNYTDALNLIEVKENGQVNSINTIDVPELTLKAEGSSRLYLTLKAEKFKFINSDKSKAELNVTANITTLELSDNSKVEALINSTDIKTDLYQRASANIEGDTDTLEVRADNSSNFIGKDLTSNTCTVLAEGDSDIYVQVIENIVIDASGASEIYVFENPKITINKFKDTVKLHKKEL